MRGNPIPKCLSPSNDQMTSERAWQLIKMKVETRSNSLRHLFLTSGLLAHATHAMGVVLAQQRQQAQ
jgi:hypothetical protein